MNKIKSKILMATLCMAIAMPANAGLFDKFREALLGGGNVKDYSTYIVNTKKLSTAAGMYKQFKNMAISRDQILKQMGTQLLIEGQNLEILNDYDSSFRESLGINGDSLTGGFKMDEKTKKFFSKANQLASGFIGHTEDMDNAMAALTTKTLLENKDKLMEMGYDEEEAEQMAADSMTNTWENTHKNYRNAKTGDGIKKGDEVIIHGDYYETSSGMRRQAMEKIRETYAEQKNAHEQIESMENVKGLILNLERAKESKLAAIQSTNYLVLVMMNQLNTFTSLTQKQFAARTALDAIDIANKTANEYELIKAQCNGKWHTRRCQERRERFVKPRLEKLQQDEKELLEKYRKHGGGNRLGHSVSYYNNDQWSNEETEINTRVEGAHEGCIGIPGCKHHITETLDQL